MKKINLKPFVGITTENNISVFFSLLQHSDTISFLIPSLRPMRLVNKHLT